MALVTDVDKDGLVLRLGKGLRVTRTSDGSLRLRLDCRSTKMAAETRFLHPEPATIARSRTGRHWIEEVRCRPGDTVEIRDITNSGKHECLSLQAGERGRTRVLVNAEPGQPCPICKEV